MGAALVAPREVRVGVDLVLMNRVTRRHSMVVLSDMEWQVLAPYAAVRPALGWALKEAAAKASGDPLSCFPGGLRIEGRPGALTVRRLCHSTGPEYVGYWVLIRPFLCAWVHSGLDCPPHCRL
jgi:hypothetical protein